MNDLISFVAGVFEVLTISAVGFACYNMGRYEELKANDDRVIYLENGNRYLVKKDGEVYLLTPQN